MIVLDTNVVSELMKASPAPAVSGWIRTPRRAELFTTSITVAEIRYGIERLAPGRRRELLRDAADDLFSAFSRHVLAFDAVAAERYPEVVIQRDAAGLPIDGFDAQIASVCRAHGAALATRNTKDFEQTGIELLDPWQTG